MDAGLGQRSVLDASCTSYSSSYNTRPRLPFPSSQFKGAAASTHSIMSFLHQSLRKCGSVQKALIQRAGSSSCRRCMTTMAREEPSAKEQKGKWVRPEVVPLVTMVSLALGLGVVSMYRQMVHSPSVLVSKAKRMNVYEVDDPDRANTLGRSFVEQSPLRKLTKTTSPSS